MIKHRKDGTFSITRPLTSRDIKERKLVEKYQHILQPTRPLTESCMQFGIEIGEGWFPLVEKLCKIINKEIKINPVLKGIHTVQIKEKFGGLRFYIYGSNDKINDAIAKAEDESFKICEKCGKRGKLRDDKYWMQTLCNEHARARK